MINLTYRLQTYFSTFLLLLFVALGSFGRAVESDTTATLTQIESSKYISRPYARIELRYPGVYRITFDDLAKADVPILENYQSLRLECDGTVVPFYLNYVDKETTSGDNYIEFVGDFARGTTTIRKPLNQANIYYLTWDNAAVAGAVYRSHRDRIPGASKNYPVRCTYTLEKDLYLSYTSLPSDLTDHYYWIMIKAAVPGMYPLWIDFPGLSMIGELPTMTLGLVGLNDIKTTDNKHLYNVFLDKQNLGQFAFKGMQRYDWTTTIPLNLAKHKHKLVIEAPEQRRSVPDSIALDWVRLTWPRILDGEQQHYFSFTDDVILTGTATRPPAIRVVGVPTNTRIYRPETSDVYLPVTANLGEIDVPLDDTTHSLYAVSSRGWLHVDSIKKYDADNSIAHVTSDTECIVIYHPRTANAARIYAEYRNINGLKTQAFDVTRIFDALNNGYISDLTLKSWLRFAYEQAPSLKYICLLGDSTNDYREIQYDERENNAEPNLNNLSILIPIHWVRNPATRHSAGYPDDNWYGAFNWPNFPDAAVGRIPANSDAEAMAYLNKVFEYETDKLTDPDKLLLISSVENEFQDLVREAGAFLADSFTTTVEMFSQNEMDNICDVLDSGVQLIYYLGHGGSFVWRFGPTDVRFQKDLFTPEHVKRLKNKGHYPIVVCSSCYVTSFDNQLSLGEEFLIEPDRGAVAVIGTPWKTSVADNHTFNMFLLKAYPDRRFKRLGDIFGQAKLNTKPRSADTVEYQTFTILGDPALELVRLHDKKTAPERKPFVPELENMQTSYTELGRLTAKDFDTRVYRNRSMITTSTITLKEVQVPADAEELMIVGRGSLEAEAFPRLNVTLEIKTNDGTRRAVTIYDHFANSMAPAAYYAPIPKEWRGRNALLRITIDNPSLRFDERVFRLAYAAFIKK